MSEILSTASHVPKTQIQKEWKLFQNKKKSEDKKSLQR